MSRKITKYVSRNRAVNKLRYFTVSSDSIDKGFVIISNIESLNLTTPGRLENTLTGIVSAILTGDKSKNLVRRNQKIRNVGAAGD